MNQSVIVIVALLLFVAIAWAVISGKLLVPVVFSTFPVIAALILGYGADEISTFIVNGLDSTYKTVALFIFSVAYFSTLNDVGIFDVLISKMISNRDHSSGKLQKRERADEQDQGVWKKLNLLRHADVFSERYGGY